MLFGKKLKVFFSADYRGGVFIGGRHVHADDRWDSLNYDLDRYSVQLERGGLYFIFLQASSCRWSGWTRKCRGYLESKHQKTQKTLLPWLAPSKDTNEINEFTKCSGCSLPLSVYWSIFFAKKKNYVDLDFSRNASASRGRMWTLCLCRRITSLGGHQLGNRLRYFSSVCRPQCNILVLFAVQNAIF